MAGLKNKKKEELSPSLASGNLSEVKKSYTPHDTSGNDYASLSGMSDLHKSALSAAKNAYDSASTDAQRRDAHTRAEAIRALYGYSGGSDGSAYYPIPKNTDQFSYDSAPSYADKYTSQIADLTQDILNRGSFTYQAESDPLYQQYKQQYEREGQRAMQDTLGQISARTGGLASSYATNAAQGAYNTYMSELADKVPELYQLAYSMYENDRDNQIENLSLLQNLETDNYNRYLNQLSQYNTDRNFAYDSFLNDRNYSYQQDRDNISDERYEREYSDTMKQADKEEAQNRINAYLAANGKVANLDQTLINNSGYTPAELSALENYYAQQKISNYRSGSGGYRTSQEDDYSDSNSSAMGIYESLAAQGASDYGTAYALLLQNGYSNTEAKEMATYFDETFYPEQKLYNGIPTWVGDYTRNLINAVSHGNISDSVLADAIDNAVSSGLMNEKEADWILTMLGR